MSSGSAYRTVAVRGRADFRLSITGTERLTPELIGAVESLCARVAEAPGAPVVILRLGTPRASVAAGPPVVEPAAIHLVSRWERSLRRLERSAAGAFAVAHGWCGGTALEALLSCDYRIGTPDLLLAPLGAAGEPWPGMIAHRLTGQLGPARVRRLSRYEGGVPGPRALDAGLVDEIAQDTPRALAAAVAPVRRLGGPPQARRRRPLAETGAVTATRFDEAFGIRPAAAPGPSRRRPGPAV
ncbi:enoyl-CoA-hydratase DpgB [Streptomyces amakusaensis]|uniref:Enoyl-CoA-hydratase DpgB n=1 Tax=Streptomyces amakusaensis TaxID=67271 RepID=A0ABW0ALZ5_9ACTN